MCCRTCTRILLLLAVAVAIAAPAFAQTADNCLQNEYNLVNKQKLNCTANDVRIAKVQNVRDPITGAPITSCIAGSKFNFLADFEIVTTSSQARENIGLYISTSSQTQALTGSCVDHIISPQHPCTSNASLTCGSDNYHETDPPPDNCGDTSSNDFSGTFGAGAELVTLEIDNFTCEAPAGSTQVQLPNCTSWQIPGGTIQCVSPSPDTYPFNGPGGTPTAIPGSPAKCNCGIIPLGVTVQSPQVTVAKACTTLNTPGDTNTSCTLSPEGGDVTYTVTITNTSNFGDIAVDQVCDTAYGTVYRSSTAPSSLAACAAGSQTGVAINSTTCNASTLGDISTTGSCTFTVTQAENLTVTDVASVSGHGLAAGTFGPSSSNSVTVVSNEAPATATVTKGFVGTEAGCATVRYSVDVHNTSGTGTDETLSLSGLDDTAYGSITSLHGSVLGTTCGVANGVGTLSGTAGAGALPANIAVDGHYQCQFDGQFCSALDNNSCISNTDKVTGSLTGDEGEAVSSSANTLTVKECLSATVTSQ